MSEIISNTGDVAHRECLSNLLKDCDEAIFAAPFIFEDFTAWLDSVDLGPLDKFTLITTLESKGQDQLLKPSALLSLVDGAKRKWPQLDVVIQIDNLLHGKVYLFKKAGKFVQGVVTSANLTHSGLGRKHEWGIRIDDASLLELLYKQLSSGVQYPIITRELLRNMVIFVDQYRRDHPDLQQHSDIDAALFNALAQAPVAERLRVFSGWDKVGKIFLKPRGDRERPVLKADREQFGEETGKLDFPKGRPTDVRSGAIIITFGTGDRCVLGLHRVLSEPEERSAEEQENDPDARRWPWFVYAENFTPQFGNCWWEHDITIDMVSAEFNAAKPDVPISAAGSKSLGAFNFGAGRLLLADDFGHFLGDRILAVEEQLRGRSSRD